MKRTCALALTLFAATLASAQPHPMRFEDLAAIHRIGAPAVSPDGKWIAYDVATPDLAANKSNSVVMLMPSGGGAAKKIADGSGPMWSPDGRTIAYVTDQVWLYDVGNAQSRKVTSLAGGAGTVKWLPDGSGLLVVSDIYPDCGVDPACIKSKEDAAGKVPTKAHIVTNLLFRHWKTWQEATRSHIVYVPLAANGTPRDLTPGAFDAPPFSVGGGDEFDVSPDGKELAYARDTEAHPEISTNSDIFLAPVGGGEAKRLTTRGGADTAPKYSPDGRWIAWRSQARAGYESDLWELWLYDRANATSHRIGSDFTNWVESIEWAPDSKTMFVVAPFEGRDVLYEVTLDGKFTPMEGAGSTSAVAVARDGKTIYVTRSSLSSPADIYAVKRNGQSQRLTHDNDALLSSLQLGATQSLFWTGGENARVQGHLMTPPGFDKTRKYPAIVLIHGGPQGAWSDSWGYRWNPQMFAARGYVVLMPNPRGSSGFGQKFVEEISGDWGGKAYADVMNGVDALVALPYVDGSRLGAAGGSFGGYMVDWILGHNDRFKALVSHAGVYDLESMYGTTEELWFPEWEFGGTPWDKPELYEKWSPHKFVKNFKTPTLVTHGELDFRVPINQGLELFTALQRRGVASKLLYFPDEGHWVLKPQNSRLWYQTVGDWFDQYLK